MWQCQVEGKEEGQGRRWMDLAREDMERVGAKEGDKVNPVKWKILSLYGDPK